MVNYKLPEESQKKATRKPGLGIRRRPSTAVAQLFWLVPARVHTYVIGNSDCANAAVFLLT